MRAILMFHSVDPPGIVGPRCSPLSITPAELVSLIAAIRSARHTIVPLETLLRDESPPANAVALTFDDAARSVATRAAPLLADAAAPATVFVATGFVGGTNDWPSQPASTPRFPLMDWRDLEALRSAGWGIGSHSVNHPDLRTLPEAALEEEFVVASETIQRRLGLRPLVHAYPYGVHDERVRNAASRHSTHALTTRFAPVPFRCDPHRVPRLDVHSLRSPLVHGRFGDTPLFRGYLALRRVLRRCRRWGASGVHAGE